MIRPGENSGNGLYTLSPFGGNGETVEAYCDMETQGGGWTLVGRSVEGAAFGAEFGWSAATGDVQDLSQPYSFNATGHRLEFANILVGVRDEEKGWLEEDGRITLYRLELPNEVQGGFLESFTSSPVAVSGIGIEGLAEDRSTCTEKPTMLTYVGFTAASDRFFLRDHPDIENFGLMPGGFAMSSDDRCATNGGLTNRQGMLFVR
jgi:hypothetical protein